MPVRAKAEDAILESRGRDLKSGARYPECVAVPGEQFRGRGLADFLPLASSALTLKRSVGGHGSLYRTAPRQVSFDRHRPPCRRH